MDGHLYPEDVSEWTWDTVSFLSENEIPESRYLEYKQHLTYPEDRDPKPSKKEWRNSIEREFTAFANADGGIILFGMSDDYDICPFEPPEHEIQRTVVQFIKDATPVPEVSISNPIEIPSSDSERILIAVKVDEATRKPVSTSDSAYYVRIGDQKQPMSREQLESVFVEADRRQQAIRQLEIQISRLRASFEDQIPKVSNIENVPPLEAIDEKAIRDALLRNTHLFADERTEGIVVGILEELDRVSALKRVYKEGSYNIDRVQFDTYRSLNNHTQGELRDRASRILELFSQLEEQTQLRPPGNR